MKSQLGIVGGAAPEVEGQPVSTNHRTLWLRASFDRLLEPDLWPSDLYHILIDGRLFLPATETFVSGADPRHFCVEQFVTAVNATLGVVICNAEAPMIGVQHMMAAAAGGGGGDLAR